MELSAVFGVLAATVYIVGLFALWIPIATQITHDFSTSWYAVSLMSRMDVIGRGVKLLGIPLLVGLAVPAFFYLAPAVARLENWTSRRIRKGKKGAADLIYPGYNRRQFDSFLEWYEQERSGLRFLLVLYASLFAASLIWSRFTDILSPLLIIRLGIIGAVGYASGDFMGRAAPLGTGSVLRVLSWKWFFRALAVLYIGVVVATFIAIADLDPPLLHVSTESQQGDGNRLVAHADGYWHVFDKDGNLLAIPDDDAGTVRVTSEPAP